MQMAAGRWDHTIAIMDMWRSDKDKPIKNPYRTLASKVEQSIPVDVKDLKGIWSKVEVC